jgi:hypothetical protein
MVKKRQTYYRPNRYGPARKKKKVVQLAPMPEIGDSVEEIVDARVNEILRYLGGRQSDYVLAKRIAKLERTVDGTLPELVAYDWLTRRGIQFHFQANVLGGRRIAGGAVPDFAIRRGGGWQVWLIQGTYYHGAAFQLRHGQEGRDVTAKLKLLGSTYLGLRIEQVVMVQEAHIRNPASRRMVFDLALAGQELPS